MLYPSHLFILQNIFTTNNSKSMPDRCKSLSIQYITFGPFPQFLLTFLDISKLRCKSQSVKQGRKIMGILAMAKLPNLPGSMANSVQMMANSNSKYGKGHSGHTWFYANDVKCSKIIRDLASWYISFHLEVSGTQSNR